MINEMINYDMSYQMARERLGHYISGQSGTEMHYDRILYNLRVMLVLLTALLLL